jgi:polyferredoxin
MTKYGFRMEQVRQIISKPTGDTTGSVAGTAAGPGHGAGRMNRGGRGPAFLLIVYALVVLGVLALLLKSRVSHRLRLLILGGSTLLFGVILSADLHPMQALVEVFKALAAGQADVWTDLLILAAFGLMAVLGTKLVCGWACPAGALQELFFRVPGLDRVRVRRTPFWLTNTVRSVVFLLFLILVFGWVFHLDHFVLYRYFNPFKLFDWNFRATAATTLAVIYGLSFFLYRPYCMLACPFGLFSWAVQRTALYRVRVHGEACVSCAKCSRACPTQAAAGILDGHKWHADCWSCGRCLEACPKGALRYGRSEWTSGERREDRAAVASETPRPLIGPAANSLEKGRP